MREPRRPQRIPKIPDVPFPDHLQPELFRLIWDPFSAWHEALLDRASQELDRLASTTQPGLAALRAGLTDRADGLFDEIFNQAQAEWAATTTSLADQLYEFGIKVDLHARLGLQRQIDLAATVDPLIQRQVPGITPNKIAEIDDFVSETSRLVKDIGNEAADKLHRHVVETHKSGDSTRKLQQKISKDLGYSEYRADFIAQDQLANANSALTEANHLESGIEGYFWSTSKDAVVRKEHQLREGEYFSYKNPPADGNPGQPIRCRCTAKPDIFGTRGKKRK